MQLIQKSFWQSKIIMGGLVFFVAGTIQAITGWYVTEEVLETTTSTFWEALNGQTLLGAFNSLIGLYMIYARSVMKMDQIEKVNIERFTFLSHFFNQSIINFTTYYE